MIDEINQSDWTYYFEGNTFRKRYDDYKDFIELFKKVWWNEARRTERAGKFI